MGYRDWLNVRYCAKESAAADAALDMALFWLRREDGCATAQDDAPLALEAHDRRFHPHGWKEGDSCKFREALEKGDSVDVLMAAEAKESESPSGGMGRKKREEYRRLMAKKRPDLNPDSVLKALSEIDDKKVQGDAFRWLMKGAVRLPEDLYKVEQARELAGKAKVDPFQFDTPQSCINALTDQGHKVSGKRITVEELKHSPYMSDYRDEGFGVETFEVEDSREGQALMRKVIDTHWGEDANPWCLLARNKELDPEYKTWLEEYRKQPGVYVIHDDDAVALYEGQTGKSAWRPRLDDAWDYWNHYDALPKRVAFKDGKLLAFMATDMPAEWDGEGGYEEDSRWEQMFPEEYGEYIEWQDSDEGQEEAADFMSWMDMNHPDLLNREEIAKRMPEQWWDREDKPHDGIPIGQQPIPGDPFGRWAGIEKMKDGTWEPVGIYEKGEFGKDGYVRWFASGGKLMEFKDGTFMEWDEDGTLTHRQTADLNARFRPDGMISEISNMGNEASVKIPLVASFDEGGTLTDVRIYPHRNVFYRGSDGEIDFSELPKEQEKDIREELGKLLEKAYRAYPDSLPDAKDTKG